MGHLEHFCIGSSLSQLGISGLSGLGTHLACQRHGFDPQLDPIFLTYKITDV